MIFQRTRTHSVYTPYSIYSRVVIHTNVYVSSSLNTETARKSWDTTGSQCGRIGEGKEWLSGCLGLATDHISHQSRGKGSQGNPIRRIGDY